MSTEHEKVDLTHTDHAQDLAYSEAGDKQGVVSDTLAAQYVDESVVISPEENKRLKWKIYTRVLPVMCVCYITQSLDKGALGATSIMGWRETVHAVGQDYALTSTIFYCGIIVGEPLVNQFIRRAPVAKILAFSMFGWSALMFGLTFALDIKAVFAIRFLLGLLESSFNPCLLAITVQWFLIEEQVKIVTIWQLQFVLAGIITNLLSYGFYHLHGAELTRDHGLYAWQWLVLCLSFISTIASAIVLIWLPDSPPQARWATPEEKVKFVERVRKNDQGIKQKVWKSEQAWEAAKDPLVYLLLGMMLLQTLVVGGLNTFNSLLINKAFGFTVLNSQLLSCALAGFQGILYILIGFLITKTNQTVYCQIAYTLVNIAMTVVLIVVKPSDKTKGGLLFAFYAAQCFQSLSPSIWSMCSRNIAGQTKKSIVYAAFFIAWATGNAVGPQFFQSAWAPRYLNSLYIHIGCYILFIADILAIRMLCVSRNKKRDRALEATNTENHHHLAFADRTDLENPEFRYSY
ncbi:major facilitator superfamily domain-containing protein [Kockovaella imperatae]|uniref:Major facilitator superfamily domain-containing protein n=1 Tax=Kockovaella imperatae TaxID=4999 RepID=A0A1Y1UJ35_9TREE|nr:major facilitator superfamily domain-containing protein [Kockovaella imperatae]ORX38061.1 major facilitator superfamily domain-containing protein [Kockovaella imperatae]